MTKKAQTKATTSETPVGPELTTAATLSTEFKIASETITKRLREAGVPVASTMVSGKRTFAFYDKAKATAALKEYIAEKARLESEKARAKEDAKQRTAQKAGASAAESLSSSTLATINETAAKLGALMELTSLQQDVTSKQFDLLNMKVDHLEKKPLNLDQSVLAEAVKAAMGDGLAGVTSAIRRQREDADKEFNAQRLAVEHHFVKVTGQLDDLLKRVSALSDVVSSLENTILAIHTAPEPQAPATDSIKSGEASKEQQFFQGNEKDKSEVPAAEEPSGSTQAKAGGTARDTPVKTTASKAAQRKVLAQENPESAGKGKGGGSTQPLAKPRVLVVGLLDRIANNLRDFHDKLDIEFIDSDKANRISSQTVVKAGYVFLMVKFIGHRVAEMKFGDAEVIHVTGGVTKVRKHLQDICLKHNII